ncbi:MAG TPA: DUF2252 family protein [Candidatus Binatia bacterium]|jgi:hypothetical protein|nr:DUF2252 family protein [Candidatus Binatia bacterium]
MNVKESTRAYERWLASQTRLLPQDLRAKHEAMAEDAFSFLRATFYRWAQLFPELCPELAEAPAVLAVGDLHVENFGTWRDSEGRLVWGINDFDEAGPMPYAIDLVRLATSARLAIRTGRSAVDSDEACDAVLEGYTEAIHAGGRAFVLAERNRWLRDMAQNKLRDPVRYWQKMAGIAKLGRPLPAEVRQALMHGLPEAGLPCRFGHFGHRRAGLGSLGRQRFTLLCEWRGGMVAREAKPLATSAWAWARGKASSAKLWYESIISRAVRVPDPFLRLQGTWVLRRLAPDCSRIELSDLPEERDSLRLLWAMGRETANIHHGSPRVLTQVKRDLRRRPRDWLRKAAARMSKATFAEWKDWKAHWRHE